MRRGSDKLRNSYGAFAGQEEVGHFHGDSGSAARFFWCPKASKQDRNEGLEGMPRKAVNWSSGDQSPGTFQSPNTDRENENFHPTVKPTELMQYLCRLVTPKGGTVLDPFMGSGSTGKAAFREGMHFVGIEIDPAYIEIARRRIVGVAPLFAQVSS
jgi:DNA modification methylase